MVYIESKQSFPCLYQTTDFDGQKIEIPVAEEDDNRYFVLDQAEEIRKYYSENGYVVLRGLLPRDLCDRANASFAAEIKPFKGYIYRQASGNPERHVFTNEGFMLNPLLNVQSLDGRHFAGFRRIGLDLLTHPHMQRAVATVLGEPGKLVQSMYFEGNPVTWPHQDTYYLDAEEIGRMTAAWVATEDIAAGAGRFFVYPKSHLIDMAKNGGNFDIAFHHDRYKELVKRVIREQELVCRAPALCKGDVLFWTAKTIHGSLCTTEPGCSRRSFTAHFIPDRSRLLQFQTRVRPLKTELVNGMQVHRPKDLSKAANRVVFFVETRFPRTFQMTKRAAIKLVTH
ncbi:MAG TPA: phytanoyl-CoA dioxygenase family protein [Stellaceae bacterium]|nr:phytanoyl-CoA dioxygenase family protein [Stellaceae bacterium]